MNNTLCNSKAHLFRFIQAVLLWCCLACTVSLHAQVIDENTSQTTTYGQIGEDGIDFIAQSFLADVWQVSRIGAWLQRDSGGGQVKLALTNDLNGLPDLNGILYESPLIEPQVTGQFFYSDPFVNLLQPGQRYWVLVDGYNNLLSSGFSSVGISTQFTDTGEGLRFSNDGGTTWDSLSGIPLAILVEGDTCTFVPDINPNVPLVCPTNPTLVGTTQGFASYLWSTGETTQEITVSTPGTYQVTVVRTDFCVGRASVEVIPDVEPIVFLPDVSDLCSGETAFLTIAPFYTSYLWSTGETTSQIEVSSPGVYSGQAFSSGGCAGGDTTIVVEVPSPNLDLGNDTTVCDGEVLEYSPGDFYNGYFWSTGSISSSIVINFATQVFVSVVDTNGCTGDSDTILVMVEPQQTTPTVQVDGSIALSSFGFEFQWYLDGLPILNANQQEYQALESGLYQVEVFNGFGCSALSDTIFIDAEPAGDFIPTGFSPNGDGVNDVFHIEAIERYPLNKLTVFNRWGDEVYARNGYQNDWMGLGLRGEKLPDGNYFFVFDKGNGDSPRKGNVLINR